MENAERTSCGAAEKSAPVILVHGIGARDRGMRASKHWGRVPKALEEAGHPVFFGDQDAWGTVTSNAVQIAKTIDSTIERTGSDKVIVVAHSKGGLDASVVESLPGMAEKIGAIITLSTPHRGMRFCDMLLRSRFLIPKVAARCVDAWARSRGDSHPDSFGALACLGTEARSRQMQEDAARPVGSCALISVGFACAAQKSPISRMVAKCDGPNDGLVPLSSTRAGDWRQVDVADARRPFRHDDCTDPHGFDFELILDDIAHPSIVSLICALVEDAARERQGSHPSDES